MQTITTICRIRQSRQASAAGGDNLAAVGRVVRHFNCGRVPARIRGNEHVGDLRTAGHPCRDRRQAQWRDKYGPRRFTDQGAVCHLGFRLPSGSPADFANTIAEETWAKAIKFAGIKLE